MRKASNIYVGIGIAATIATAHHLVHFVFVSIRLFLFPPLTGPVFLALPIIAQIFYEVNAEEDDDEEHNSAPKSVDQRIESKTWKENKWPSNVLRRCVCRPD